MTRGALRAAQATSPDAALKAGLLGVTRGRSSKQSSARSITVEAIGVDGEIHLNARSPTRRG